VFDQVAGRMAELGPMPGFLPPQRKPPAVHYLSRTGGPDVEIVPTPKPTNYCEPPPTRPTPPEP
jgi:hypothetical protein